MNLAITSGNTLAILALTFGMIVSFRRYLKKQEKPQLLLAFALILLWISALLNIFEHSNYQVNVGEFEELVGILFIPILIFSLHAAIINKELIKRKKSEKKFKAIFNQTYSFIGLLSPDGILLDSNTTAKKFAGYTETKPEGTHFAETKWWNHSEIEQQKIYDAIQKAQQGEMVRFETTHLDEFHQAHHVDFSLKPLYDDLGSLLYLIPEGRDITEIVNIRLELEKHKNNLEELVYERTEELHEANSEISAMNEDLQEKNKTLESYNNVLEEHRQNLENALKKLKEAQSSLIESEKMASIGVLTAGIAHEINNPINFISSNLTGLQKVIERFDTLFEAYNQVISEHQNEDLAKEIETLDKTYHKKENKEALSILTKHIQTGIDRTVEIINSLKYFLHSEQNTKSYVNVHDIISSVLTILHNEYKHKIEIVEDFQLKSEIKCVAGKINQVIMNILSNAIQAIPENGHIYIKTWQKKDEICISIKNDGVPISEEVLPKIFDPFFSTKPVGKGTGLGLFISYNIIKDHNGKINVISDNEHTEFQICLPVNAS